MPRLAPAHPDDETTSIVEERPGLFRLPGISRDELAKALRLFSAAKALQAEEATSRRPQLLEAMVAAGIDPVPEATIEQARRLARHRERLLTSGAYTLEALARLRGDRSESTTRTWLSRQRQRHALFTVEWDGATLLPSFQLGPDAAPRPGLQPVLAVLSGVRLGGWELWTWFAAASSWVGGRVPATLLDEDPEVVHAAACAFVSSFPPRRGEHAIGGAGETTAGDAISDGPASSDRTTAERRGGGRKRPAG